MNDEEVGLIGFGNDLNEHFNVLCTPRYWNMNVVENECGKDAP